jgi:site-specific DNA-methyltransferase (adenine-specific)
MTNSTNVSENITIIHGDSLELIKNYPDSYFDIAIIDPPYGIGEDGSKNHSRSNKTGKGWPGMHVRGKEIKSKDYVPFAGGDSSAPTKEYFQELFRVSKTVILWGANHYIENIPKQNASCRIVWDKENGNNDFADCELAWTNIPRAVRKFKYKWHGMLQEDMKNKEVRIHPTQKPVELYKWLLSKYAVPGNKVLDTHLGSGSIGIACYDLGFSLTGIELSEYYYNKAVERIRGHIDDTPSPTEKVQFFE